MEYKLGIIGYGNMASAIADAIVRSEVLKPEEIATFDGRPRARQKAMDLGLQVTETVGQLCRGSAMILLAVKPNMAASVLQEAGPALEGKALMSIAAGVPSRKLKEFAGSYFLRILRIMPNTPAMVGAGAMVLSSNTDFLPEEQRRAEELMSAVGTVEWIEERHMDAVTGLSGSGPAYVAMFIEALADGGVKEGLSRPQAMNLAVQTVLGTAQLLREKQMHPGELKDMVCSPGGTAIEGVQALEDGGFRHTAMNAVVAASEKSKRLI
ncbi:MAG: pyrroline-5-carboxylate reductase [Lachnospiraceae bacterium]|nr:pyrroline-5-carboxylate reductase [Lachnospiraceae bacterium]